MATHIYQPVPRRPFARAALPPISTEEGPPQDLPASDPARVQASMTASTLDGIFGSIGSPTCASAESDAIDTTDATDVTDAMAAPDWDTGVSDADVAALRRAAVDLVRLQREAKAAVSRPRPAATVRPPSPPLHPPSSLRPVSVFPVPGRVALLFALGLGYGMLVSRLHHHTQRDSVGDVELNVGNVAGYVHAWRYASWGVSGVVLGLLLPWCDGLVARRRGPVTACHRAPETDWASLVRGIGAFAGVVFAMRKLQWASSMQAALALALTNPFLWYLLDRSRAGLLLATSVGLVGSGVLAVLDLDLLPGPGRRHAHAVWATPPNPRLQSTNGSSAVPLHATEAAFVPRAAPEATVETAVWMVSVLFCSCVCFGSIGRRLARL